jgi:hypothetical protein
MPLTDDEITSNSAVSSMASDGWDAASSMALLPRSNASLRKTVPIRDQNILLKHYRANKQLRTLKTQRAKLHVKLKVVDMAQSPLNRCPKADHHFVGRFDSVEHENPEIRLLCKDLQVCLIHHFSLCLLAPG